MACRVAPGTSFVSLPFWGSQDRRVTPQSRGILFWVFLCINGKGFVHCHGPDAFFRGLMQCQLCYNPMENSLTCFLWLFGARVLPPACDSFFDIMSVVFVRPTPGAALPLEISAL
jgi:hypothetical protein